MRSRTIIATLAVLLGIGLLLVAAAYIMLRSMDLGAFRPEIIAKVKAATGRDLQIAGDLEVALQEGLTIRAKGLALSNADWGSRPKMLELERAEARLALLPLLFGRVHVKGIELHGVDLILETDASGRGNWAFGLGSGTTGAGGEMPSVSIESGQVTWRDGRRPGSDPLVFSDLQLVADVDVDDLRLDADAHFKGEALALSGRLPTPQALAGGKPQDLALRLRVGAAEVKGSGDLQLAAWGLNPRLKIHAEGLDSAAVGRLVGGALPALPKVTLSLDLSREADAWRFVNLDASAGGSDLTGELRLSTAGDRPRLSVNLDANKIDLNEWIPESEPRGHAGEVAAVEWRRWLDALKTIDGTLQVRAAQLRTLDLGLADLRIEGRLDGGRLVLEPVEASVSGGGQTTGRLELDATADRPVWGLALRLRNYPAGVLLGRGHASLVDAPLNLDLDLKAAGSSPQQMTKSLGGDVRLVVGRGRARIKRIDALVGGLSTLTGQLLARGGEDSQLNCAVGDFQIQRGVATANVLLIDSAVSTVRGDGRIDLGARQLDLTFTPRPKNPSLTVAVPVHVHGPMDQPAFVADRKATLGKLIGVAGLFVFPPAAVVTLGDLGGSGNPCIDLLRVGDAPEPSAPGAAEAQEAGDGVVKGIGRGLKRIFGQ